MVSIASAQIFPDNTLSSFTNFLTEQVNLEGQWEVAISEKPYPSLYQKVIEENSCFLMKKFQSRLIFTIWNPVITLPLRILLKL